LHQNDVLMIRIPALRVFCDLDLVQIGVAMAITAFPVLGRCWVLER
jgi:hypothetical protein